MITRKKAEYVGRIHARDADEAIKVAITEYEITDPESSCPLFFDSDRTAGSPAMSAMCPTSRHTRGATAPRFVCQPPGPSLMM